MRARMSTRTPPGLQAEAIWGKPGWDGVANKTAMRVLDVLDELPNKRVYYQVVSAPLISDRDYVLRIERVHEGELYEVRFTSIDDARRPQRDSAIRMKIRGQSVIEPDEGGGSVVTYEIATELGGSIPAWITRSAHRKAAIEWMQVMRNRGEKLLSEPKSAPKPASKVAQ